MASPPYPVAATMVLIKTNRMARIFSVMKSADRAMPDQNAPSCVKLKPGRRNSVGGLGDLHLDGGLIGRGDLRGPQNRIPRENTSLYTFVTRKTPSTFYPGATPVRV